MVFAFTAILQIWIHQNLSISLTGQADYKCCFSRNIILLAASETFIQDFSLLFFLQRLNGGQGN